MSIQDRINKIQFSTTRVRAGYNQDEVDNFLDSLAQAVAKAEGEAAQLQARAAQLEKQLRSREEATQELPSAEALRVLSMAAETADRARQEAAAQAEEQLADARKAAEKILADARAEAERAHEKVTAERREELDELGRAWGQLRAEVSQLQEAKNESMRDITRMAKVLQGLAGSSEADKEADRG